MLNIIKKSICFPIFAGIVLIFSVSCSNSKPEITFGFIKLILYQTEDGYREQYSFFILPEDEEGMENLDEFYLYHDREQLRWKVKNDEWLRSAHDGKEWIGTRSIAASEGNLPRGVFRAVLVNKSGESSERTFTFDGNVRFQFPELEIINGVYTIKSNWPVNRLVCYDASGNYAYTANIDSLTGNLSNLRLPSSVSTVALWTEDEENQCSAFTDVVPIN
ncbi:MAG: hypothetical protein FWC01_03635 [Treponema sp.]|nr:hypothetical protein [Treponema sp.]MCL2230161.1 hypothetical protein [Treponema sp.]